MFELALALGKTVGELNSEMSYAEYSLWLQYFQKRPLGWREDQRAFKLMLSSGNLPKNAKTESYFHSAAVMKTAEVTNLPGRGTQIHNLMMSAKGGDIPDFLKDL